MSPKDTRENIKLLIIGIGYFAIEVADLASDISNIQVAGFISNTALSKSNSTLLGKPIYFIDDLVDMNEDVHAVSGTVTTKRYIITQQVEELGIKFTSVIHPSARISNMSVIADGSVISAGVLVSTHTQIGRHVVINRGAIIGHHNTIGDHVTISPGANLAGYVKVAQRAYVGMGANVLDRVKIGEQALISAGSLVKEDVPDRTLVEGIPSKIVAQGIDGY